MNLLLLALMLHGSPEPPSLGVALDVLPEAYTFAAHRVSYAPIFRLSKCGSQDCVWDLGDLVSMAAEFEPESLALRRLEARLASDKDPRARNQYQKACMAIVALFLRDGAPAKRKAISDAIAQIGDARAASEIDVPDHGFSFYGSSRVDRSDLRCGAALPKTEMPSPP